MWCNVYVILISHETRENPVSSLYTYHHLHKQHNSSITLFYHVSCVLHQRCIFVPVTLRREQMVTWTHDQACTKWECTVPQLLRFALLLKIWTTTPAELPYIPGQLFSLVVPCAVDLFAFTSHSRMHTINVPLANQIWLLKSLIISVRTKPSKLCHEET